MRFLWILFILCVPTCYGCDGVFEPPQPSNQSHQMLESMLDQGERSLLASDFLTAVDYFSSVIDASSDTAQDPYENLQMGRALLCRSFASSSLGLHESAMEDLRTFENLITSYTCVHVNNYTAGDKPILGPDTISVQDCLDLVNNTISMAEEILALAPLSSGWKLGIIGALRLSGNKASQCCRAGGVWKACLQPLFIKWLELKEWERSCRNSGRWFQPYLPD